MPGYLPPWKIFNMACSLSHATFNGHAVDSNDNGLALGNAATDTLRHFASSVYEYG